MMRNITLLAERAKGFESLFRDAPALVVGSDPESLEALISVRIQEHRHPAHNAEVDTKTNPASPPLPEEGSNPAPVDRPAPEEGSNPAPVDRPAPEVIVSVVAGYFDVSDDVALGWLMDISIQEVA